MKKTEFEPRDLFISFRDLMLYILLRWKSILLVALAGALLVGGLTYVQDTRRYQAAGETATHEPAVPELTPEDMSHLTGISQKLTGPVNEKAFRDCVATVLRENAVKQVDTDEELMAFRNKLKERKGTGT